MTYKSHKIAAVIPCRVQSTRLLAKPLQRVGEFTILELLVRQLKKSKLIDDIIIAISKNTGRDLFIELAKTNKLKFVVGDEVNVLGRLILGARKTKADIIFRITSENPYMFWEGIDGLIKNHIEGDYDLSIYTKLPLGAAFEIIKLQALEYSNKHGNKKYRSEYSTLYIHENPKKFKINQVRAEKTIQRPDIRLTVDTPQDLLVARMIYDKLGNKGKPIPLKNIIKFMDMHPKIKKINAKIPQKYKQHLL